MKRRSALWRTQNFLRSPAVIRSILARSGIRRGDTLIDIGAGRGVITAELSRCGAHVIAIEADRVLCDHLSRRFSDDASVRVVCQDFMRVELPKDPYKVFASLPFDITTAILSRLTAGDRKSNV